MYVTGVCSGGLELRNMHFFLNLIKVRCNCYWMKMNLVFQCPETVLLSISQKFIAKYLGVVNKKYTFSQVPPHPLESTN